MEVADIDGIGGDNGDVVVVQIDHALGVGDDGGGVGRDDGFALADADDDGTAAAGSDDLVRLAGGKHGDAEGAFDLMERVADGLEKVALVAVSDEVGEDFGVGLGVEVVAFSFEPGAEGTVVFDDAVMDERDVAGLVEMRVGVDLGWRAVGGPAGVGDAGGGALEKLGRPLSVGAVVELGDFSGCLGDDDPFVIQNRDARRVVAPVFETTQAVDEHSGCIYFSDVSDDSAHGVW